jgi:hypothetical protein
MMFEFREELLDRVQVRGVFREQQQFGSDTRDNIANSSAFMGAEIVHDDGISRLQGWDKDMLDIGTKALAIGRSFSQPPISQTDELNSIQHSPGGDSFWRS